MEPERIELTITDITTSGQGIGKHQGIAVFVDNATIGDQVIAEIRERKAGYFKAKVINIRKPSAHRTKPVCKHFHNCGSCQLQDLSYSAQLDFKQQSLKETLLRLGGFGSELLPELEVIAAAEPFYYRNKAQLPVQKNGKELQVGYYRSNSHQLVDLDECHLHHTDFMKVIQEFKRLLRDSGLSIYHEHKHSGLLRHLCLRVSEYTREMQLTLVINGSHLAANLELENFIIKLNGQLDKYQIASVMLNINTDKGNRIFGKKNILLWGQEYISEKVGEHFFRISPNTFLQVNLTQAENLYRGLVELLPNNSRTILDLYCGVGTITLNISDRAQRVIGVEQNPQAVKDARQNCRNNSIDNVEFIKSSSEDLEPEQFNEVDVIIVDPPRKGLESPLIEKLKVLAAKELYYISCNPATLARDLQQLVSEGPYLIDKIKLYDLFPQTTHIETLVRLTLAD